MAQYNALQEEELKIRIAEQFFASYDCGNRIGKIDFCAVQKQNNAIFAIDLKNVPTAHFVGERHALPANTEEDYMQRVSRSKSLLSVVVGNFKSAITHFANIHNIGFA